MVSFYGKARDYPLSAVPHGSCFIYIYYVGIYIYIYVGICVYVCLHMYLPIWRPFLLLQPETVACCDDRNPFLPTLYFFKINLTFIIQPASKFDICFFQLRFLTLNFMCFCLSLRGTYADSTVRHNMWSPK
jgi:hypothetical protein